MLAKTEQKLRSYYDNEPQIGTDGQPHTIDRVTRINWQQCELLAGLHKSIRPALSIETGLAYGFSTLPLLDAMEEHGYGHHIAIDPAQNTYWHGVALASIAQAGLTKRFTWLESRSDIVLPQLIADGKKAQFFYFDGVHSFEGILADFYLADQMLETNGITVFNYKWMPAGRAIASFISNNMAHYESVPIDHEMLFAFRKIGEDAREWDHFAPFDGAGTDPNKPRPKTLWASLQRLFRK